MILRGNTSGCIETRDGWAKQLTSRTPVSRRWTRRIRFALVEFPFPLSKENQPVVSFEKKKKENEASFATSFANLSGNCFLVEGDD